jgi:plastocyanin
MKKVSLLALPLALLGAAFFLGGCGYQAPSQGATPSYGNSTPQAPSPATTPVTNPAATAPSSTTNQTANAVTIQNFAFSPASLTIKKGESVTWTNKDSTSHTITSDSNVFQSASIGSGQTFSFTFNTAGQFPYHCSIHPSMKAMIIVQ